jgi:hypothetical protein
MLGGMVDPTRRSKPPALNVDYSIKLLGAAVGFHSTLGRRRIIAINEGSDVGRHWPVHLRRATPNVLCHARQIRQARRLSIINPEAMKEATRVMP